MRLERYAYTQLGVLGRLRVRDYDAALHTLERPWIPGQAPGGRPSVSCVPDGRYELLRHQRPTGDVCVALRNPALGVYYSPDEVPAAGGRSLILCHPANIIGELEGCVAPGLSLAISQDRFAMLNSREAHALVMKAFADGDSSIDVVAALGAVDG